MSAPTPNLLGTWRRVRRYAVPASMIEAATAARLAGDWRGACAAAGVDVAVPDGSPFADDLRHFAPDLLRWHLPRRPGRGDTTLTPRVLVHLAGDGPYLYVGSPRLGFGSQRLRLFVDDELINGDSYDEESEYHQHRDFTGRRELWDARQAGRLLERNCGRMPFFDPAGRRLEPAGYTALEHTLLLQDAGRMAEAWRLAGAEVPDPPAEETSWKARYLVEAYRDFRCDLAAVLAGARSLAASTGTEHVGVPIGWHYLLRFGGLDTDRPKADWVEVDYEELHAPWHLDPEPYLRPIDVDLVRLGAVPPSWLHPLVRAALFPAGAAGGRVAEPVVAPVRVRCNGRWHQVRMVDGRMAIPHSAEERQREHTLQALGGRVHGCFAAEQAWRDRGARLPRALDAQRTELMQRAQHGDAAGVGALLDAGVDPHARDGHGRTLLHLMSGLMAAPDELALFRRLVAAGLDVEARDARGRTPLHAAVHDTGSPELIRAFLAAGARLDTVDGVGDTLGEALTRNRLPELQFLADLL